MISIRFSVRINTFQKISKWEVNIGRITTQPFQVLVGRKYKDEVCVLQLIQVLYHGEDETPHYNEENPFVLSALFICHAKLFVEEYAFKYTFYIVPFTNNIPWISEVVS